MTLIVHISADFPDVVQPNKTKAVSSLLEATADRLEHLVYSLNRVGGPRSWFEAGAVQTVQDDLPVITWKYVAPRWGFALARSMRALAEEIHADLQRRGIRPDIIHGHKLSIEGLAAWHLAKRLKVPLVVSLQGNTDQKIISARPDLRASYRKVWRDAAIVFSFSPWTSAWHEAKLGARAGPIRILPCILSNDEVLAPAEAPARVTTAFNFNDWANKNFDRLVRAVSLARERLPEIEFDIAGSGDAAAEAQVARLVSEAGLAAVTTLRGNIPPERIQEWMNGSTVFALPSLRESFGMVFVEAVLAGTPIIYPRGAAVDGYFDDHSFALAVDARSERSIAEAIIEAVTQNARLKQDLRNWQTSGGPAPFQHEAISAAYADAMAGLQR